MGAVPIVVIIRWRFSTQPDGHSSAHEDVKGHAKVGVK